MRLPVPDPRPALTLVGQGRQLLEDLAGALPRVLALLDRGEVLLTSVEELVARIEATRESADKVIIRTAGTVGSVEPTIARAQRLLDTMAPSLEQLQPTLQRLAESTSPEEVEALIRLIDHLPDLVDRTITDILPIVENMKSVAPDIHDMLDTMHELNEMIAKIPGMGRIRQRVEDKQADAV